MMIGSLHVIERRHDRSANSGAVPAWPFRGPVRRGFLMFDLIAATALTGLVLIMVATLVRTDHRARRTQELRFRMLTAAENVMARLENVPGSALTPELARKLTADAVAAAAAGPVILAVEVSDVADVPGARRVIVQGRESADRPPAVFLVRDFFAEGGGR